MPYNFDEFKEKNKKSEEWLKKEYAGLHTGHASPLVLDSLSIEVYGDRQPIKNIATISVEDPKTLRVLPWDRAHVKEIEKAISDADLGLTTAVDGTGMRIIFPMLTTENRQRLVKVLKDKMEDARISVRKDREDAWNAIQKQEKEGGLTEDEKFKAKEDLQKYVDIVNANLEVIFKKKEDDVLNK